MAGEYTRIHRLLKILTLIQGESGWSTKRLAMECGRSERSIFRDLKTLEGAGIPYFYDEETGGYSIRRDFFLPALSLTLDESLSLLALAEKVGGKEQIPFTEAAGKAISKVRCNLPGSIRDELALIEEHMEIQLAAANSPEGSKDVYATVRSALMQKRALECEYDSAGSRRENGDGAAGRGQFVFKPYTLFYSQRAWYAIGHHERRDAVRTLKLSRFTMCKPTDKPYAIPDDFSLKKHLGNAWRMIRGKKRYDVELWFDADFADTVADTHWHATQEIVWNDDGSINFRCRVDGLDEILWWVLGYGPHCVVKKPKELAERTVELAAGILGKYRSKP